MAKFTPGPLEVESHRADRNSGTYFSVEAPILHGTGVVADTLNCHHCMDEDEQRANMVLFAASQDLLAACRAMLECTGGSAHWQGETHTALLKIEAAVLKATGK